jgi:hypothetical protein
MLVVVSTGPGDARARRSAGAGSFTSQPVVESRLARRPMSRITITAPRVSRPTTNIPRPAQIAQSSLTPASASTSIWRIGQSPSVSGPVRARRRAASSLALLRSIDGLVVRVRQGGKVGRVEAGGEAVHGVAGAPQLRELPDDCIHPLPELRRPLRRDAGIPEARPQFIRLVGRKGLGGGDRKGDSVTSPFLRTRQSEGSG